MLNAWIAIEKALNPNPPQQPIAVKKEVPFFKDFAAVFLDISRSQNKPASIESKEGILRLHLIPFLGGLRLDQVSYAVIQDYVTQKLKEGLSKKTIANQQAVLSNLLSIAVKREILPHMPRFDRVKPERPRTRYLEFQEAERLVASLTGQLRTMVILVLKTGMRIGEVLALDWSDVDFQNGTIHVCKGISRGLLGTTKSGKDRTIPLGPDMQEILRQHHQNRISSHVFVNGVGGRVTRSQATKWILRAVNDLGLKISWHGLRHTFASHLTMLGAQLQSVQELLGHSEIRMTERYSHLSPHVRWDAVLLLDDQSAICGKKWQKSLTDKNGFNVTN